MRFLITERQRLDENIHIKYYSFDKSNMGTLILELLTIKDGLTDVIHALVAYNRLNTKTNALSFILFADGNPMTKNWPLINLDAKEPDVHIHPSDKTGLGNAMEMVFFSDNYYELEKAILDYYGSLNQNRIVKIQSQSYLNTDEFSLKFLGR
jgi:hypothetical protein